MDDFDMIQSDEYAWYYDAGQEIFEDGETFTDFPEVDEI